MIDTYDETQLPPLQQQAIEWLMLLRTRELTNSETLAFAEWLSSDVEHADAFATAEDLFNGMTHAAYLHKTRSAPTLAPVPEKTSVSIIPQRPPRRPARWLALPLGLAAAWLFAVTLVLPQQADLWHNVFSDYHTGTGRQNRIVLSDGSEVLLNTDTAISVDYSSSSRRITLHHGQALFTVAKDPARPYEVDTGEVTVRALGTVFEVYRKNGGDVSVLVEEHSVATSLNANHRQQATLVEQGQQLHYNHDSGQLGAPQAADSQLSSAWTRNQVVVNDRPLAELIAEIERYRNGRIFLSGDLQNLRVSGLFSMADPELALKKVSEILHLKQTRVGPLWVFLHR